MRSRSRLSRYLPTAGDGRGPARIVVLKTAADRASAKPEADGSIANDIAAAPPMVAYELSVPMRWPVPPPIVPAKTLAFDQVALPATNRARRGIRSNAAARAAGDRCVIRDRSDLGYRPHRQ